MDSLSTPVVSAAKLSILNPNEFDLWKMRIEQYFLMTDYSLWEVIINGDSPALTIVVDGIVQPVSHKSADQKLARRNELKACGSGATEPQRRTSPFENSTSNALVSQCDESDSESLSPSSPSDRLQSTGGYHVVPPPITGTFMPPKPDLPVEAPILAATLKPTSPKSTSSSKRKNRKTCFVCRSVDHLIKDLLTQSTLVSITAARPVCVVVPKIMVTRPRHAHSINTKSKSPIRRHITCSPKTSNLPSRVTAAQAPVVNVAKGERGKWGNPQYALKDKGVIDSGCSRHMTENMSYLSDFEELNGGYVAFGGNPTGGKISGKGKIKTGKLDFKDVYFVKELKFNLFSVSQMCDKKNKVLFT
nr:ribonuclease H-like domain-containing protein [Tanacetum cinerariifolium]